MSQPAIFQNGTRIWMWAANSEVVYRTVEAMNRMPDGTQVVVVRLDGTERTVTIPAATVARM